MKTFDNKRYQELHKLFSYLNNKKPVTAGKGDRFMIVCYKGNYIDQEDGAEIRMVSVVDTEQAAHFIARWVNIRDELTYLPKIYRTNAALYPSEKGSVSEYLASLEKQYLALKEKLEKSSKIVEEEQA